MSRHGMKGPHGGMRGGAKAKDFKGSLKKLVKYMSVYKVQMLFVAVFAVCGTVFNIVGPKILGKATTEIFNGLVSKVSGGSGMDFGKIGQILLITLGLYVVSALCSFIQGMIMTGISQKTTYRLRKDITEKVNRMPMDYFDTKPVGEVLSRVTNDVDTLGQSLNQSATQLITSVTTLIGVLVMMLSAYDGCGAVDPADFRWPDLIRYETFAEIFQRTAGISRKCKRSGRGSVQRTQRDQGI